MGTARCGSRTQIRKSVVEDVHFVPWTQTGPVTQGSGTQTQVRTLPQDSGDTGQGPGNWAYIRRVLGTGWGLRSRGADQALLAPCES